MATKIPSELYHAIYSQVPRACVELVIINPQGILFTLRDIEPKKGFWHLPGGTLLLDESVEEAASRVAQEELGVKIEMGELLTFIDYYQTDSVRGHAVSLVFQVSITEGGISLDAQASKFEYFSQPPENVMPEYLKLFKILEFF